MSKGIKKIKCIKNGWTLQRFQLKDRLVIAPDRDVLFEIEEWEKETTDDDKKKLITWMLQSQDRKTIIHQEKKHSTEKFAIKLPKKFCGVYDYYIEASLFGKRDFKNNTGLYIRGWCLPKITSSKWTKKYNGESIKNSKKENYINYGEDVFLQLDTEGLNGSNLIIEIWNRQFLGDKHIHTYTNVKVLGGEVNLKITNTYAWKASVNNIQNVEEFYIKVKNQSTQEYIKDTMEDELHAIYLNIKNKVVSKKNETSQNLTASKVFNPNNKKNRYEPCKFDTIKITDKEDTIILFNKGEKLNKSNFSNEKVTRSIFFNFDSTMIEKHSEFILKNILEFLLGNSGAIINLNGYACVIGKETYNKELSQRRADVVKNFFIERGLDPNLIISTGKGEIKPSDDKSRDDIKYKNEKEYQQNRRVDISFSFSTHEASSLIYETIAPSVKFKKELAFDVIGFETKACFRENNKHKKEIRVIDIGQVIDKGDTEIKITTPSFNYEVYSDLSMFNLFPIQYILPKLTTPNQFHFHIHSCRWFSNTKNATILVKAYPDIKWSLSFFINLTNDLSIKWQNQPAEKFKNLQEKAGKIGAERRWKQKDASFGFSLKSEWEKVKGNYIRTKELRTEYEAKFKKLYDVFTSLGALSDGITNKTKGQIRNIGMKGIPIVFAIKPPNLNLKAVWLLERVKKNNVAMEKVGTNVAISFNADPLIGLEMTIDLLCTATGLVAGAISGGTASEPAMKLYGIIKEGMNKGGKVGNDKLGIKIKSDIYIDLVISSVIKTNIGFSFNTGNLKNSTQAKAELTNTLKVELKAGMWVKSEVSLILVKVDAYFEMSGKGSAAITFGNQVNFDNKSQVQGLYYRPQLGFDGLSVEYVIKGKVGLSSKKTVLGGKAKSDDEGIISKDRFENLVPKFDVIKSLEELFGISANIPLIKN